MSIKHWVTTLLGAALVLTASLVVAEQSLDDAKRDLPSFELSSLDGEQWQAATLAGKPWVINFWATWCPPCIDEIPSMNTAWEDLEPQGVGMLAINAGEGADVVNGFMGRMSIDFPVLLGDAGSLANWSVRALPTTIIVNGRGEVVYEALGPREWDDAALLKRVLDLRE